MELMKAYLYNQFPFQTTDISARTISNLLTCNWFEDDRKSAAYTILHRRLLISSQWYKITLRFKKEGPELLSLDTPAPFMVVLSEVKEADNKNSRFVDKQVYHSKTVGTVSGYLEKGIPAELIDAMIEEFRISVQYGIPMVEIASANSKLSEIPF
ncbi:hypothetical protein TCA2_4411 [Paenibacillus sp. TCA20]|uniref:Uncharacterized protein n=1 Tax=Paenibacillus urinalis TaxID=521520 RepID=A0ABY7XKF4_9BACL|nr:MULTISPECIES: hypothetical protein [Paenibacillus]WDI05249.1 hypothetical protein PUW25_25915 [Paenibacillus urinalis]GAK41919.1 hypothetical protein TCA2_4411 [Paenibacillus sp. TCA20]